MIWRFLFMVGLCYFHFSHAEPLKICSFNVQIFGKNKAKNDQVMETLGKIFSRFDLCLIQEIRDTNNASVTSLLAKINQNKDGYDVVLSDRLGRTDSKEQYGFFYNTKKINVESKFVFPDDQYGDLFEREPFVVQFKAPTAPIKNFFIAGIHTNPSNAQKEIASLVQVYNYSVQQFHTVNGVIMGDFNAGCSYFPKSAWKDNALRKDERFLWLVGDNADTTVGKSKCPYDRFVVAGCNLQKHSRDAEAWYYDKEFGLSKDDAKRVSDHYPIEFELR